MSFKIQFRGYVYESATGAPLCRIRSFLRIANPRLDGEVGQRQAEPLRPSRTLTSTATATFSPSCPSPLAVANGGASSSGTENLGKRRLLSRMGLGSVAALSLNGIIDPIKTRKPSRCLVPLASTPMGRTAERFEALTVSA